MILERTTSVDGQTAIQKRVSNHQHRGIEPNKKLAGSNQQKGAKKMSHHCKKKRDEIRISPPEPSSPDIAILLCGDMVWATAITTLLR